jgi:hypothetical protein
MILEGLVTTLNADGTGHLAPMGPHVDGPAFTRFVLKPFQTSQTYKNLKAHGEGVLHTTDDVLLLAKAAAGAVSELPPHFDAITVQGFVLSDACRFFEFRVRSLNDREERTHIECEVYHSGTLRDFFGFNRAKHAVLEAAILTTRSHLKSREEIDAEFRRLRIIVDKTAGAAELEAMAFLEAEWARFQRDVR